MPLASLGTSAASRVRFRPFAVRCSAQPVALYLVQHGADPNQVSRRTNSTAYGLAFGAGMSDVLVEMEQHGGRF